MTKSTAVVISAGALAGVLGLGAIAQEDDGVASSGAWEHLALQHDLGEGFSTPELSRQIVTLGEDGWELVSVENYREGTNSKMAYFFKRRK